MIEEEAAIARAALITLAKHLQAGGTLPRCVYVDMPTLPTGYEIVRGDCGDLWHVKKGKDYLRRANRSPFGHRDYDTVLRYAQLHAELGLPAHEAVPDWK